MTFFSIPKRWISIILCYSFVIQSFSPVYGEDELNKETPAEWIEKSLSYAPPRKSSSAPQNSDFKIEEEDPFLFSDLGQEEEEGNDSWDEGFYGEEADSSQPRELTDEEITSSLRDAFKGNPAVQKEFRKIVHEIGTQEQYYLQTKEALENIFLHQEPEGPLYRREKLAVRALILQMRDLLKRGKTIEAESMKEAFEEHMHLKDWEKAVGLYKAPPAETMIGRSIQLLQETWNEWRPDIVAEMGRFIMDVFVAGSLPALAWNGYLVLDLLRGTFSERSKSEFKSYIDESDEKYQEKVKGIAKGIVLNAVAMSVTKSFFSYLFNKINLLILQQVKNKTGFDILNQQFFSQRLDTYTRGTLDSVYIKLETTALKNYFFHSHQILNAQNAKKHSIYHFSLKELLMELGMDSGIQLFLNLVRIIFGSIFGFNKRFAPDLFL